VAFGSECLVGKNILDCFKLSLNTAIVSPSPEKISIIYSGSLGKVNDVQSVVKIKLLPHQRILN
jgi:hypothetical protein